MIIIGYIIFGIIIAFAGIDRRIGFWKGLMWCVLLSPFIGLFIILNSGKLNARGCKHCGNKYNEAEYCGICKKNEDGSTREDVAIQLQSK